jgi:ABC-2 type transport system permease protein
MVPARLWAVAAKEAKHVRRDVRSLLLALGIPLLLLWLFGYALTLDVEHVPTVVLDLDETPASRELISRFAASPYFNLAAHLRRPAEIGPALTSGRALLALTVPRGFGAGLGQDKPQAVQVLLDGSDSSTASIASAYVQALLKAYSLDLARERLNRLGQPFLKPPVEVKLRVWFNQETKSRNFIIPGLIVVIIMVMTAQLTSLTVAREWESGTLEWLAATPVTPAEVILGKLLPYLAIGFIDVTITVLAGVVLFQEIGRASCRERVS